MYNLLKIHFTASHLQKYLFGISLLKKKSFIEHEIETNIQST